MQARVFEAFDRLVDAVEVNVHTLTQRSFRQTDAVGEVGVPGCGGDEQAEFFAAHKHVGSVGTAKERVKLPWAPRPRRRGP